MRITNEYLLFKNDRETLSVELKDAFYNSIFSLIKKKEEFKTLKTIYYAFHFREIKNETYKESV